MCICVAVVVISRDTSRLRLGSDVEDLLLLGQADNRLEHSVELPSDVELGSESRKFLALVLDYRWFSSEIWDVSQAKPPRE